MFLLGGCKTVRQGRLEPAPALVGHCRKYPLDLSRHDIYTIGMIPELPSERLGLVPHRGRYGETDIADCLPLPFLFAMPRLVSKN